MATIRISIDGQKKTYREWSKQLRIPEQILRTRYSLGLRGAELKKRVHARKTAVTFMGRKGTIKELAKKFKVNYHIMWCAAYVAKKAQRASAR